jgi:HSF-type DNA-binding
VYRDHADKDEQWVQQLHMNNVELRHQVRHTRRQDGFPVKLHMMIEATSTSDQADIIRWLPHGRAFKFFDRGRLLAEVLPHYLPGQTKFSSFQRQLNMYGFLKLTGDSSDKGAYYHECFLRGRAALSWLIFRQVGTHGSVRRKFDVESEPDFSQMAPVTKVSTMRDSDSMILSSQEYSDPNVLEPSTLPWEREFSHQGLLDALPLQLPHEHQGRERSESASLLLTMAHGQAVVSGTLLSSFSPNLFKCIGGNGVGEFHSSLGKRALFDENDSFSPKEPQWTTRGNVIDNAYNCGGSNEDAKSHVSLDLSHNCGSLWDDSDNEHEDDEVTNEEQLCTFHDYFRKTQVGMSGGQSRTSV